MSFDPPPTSSGGDSNSGGSKLTSSGTSSGAAASGGSKAAAGSGTDAGTGNATGGTNNQAGTGNNAGSNAGGKGGANAMAGASGNGEAGGMAGAGGKGGATGTAGSGGMGGAGGNGGVSGAGGMGGAGGGANCVPKPEVCDGVDNNCDTVVDPPGTCLDSCTGATFGGHTYLFCGVVGGYTASVAYNKCSAAGMAMTSINSQAENDFVTNKQKGSSWLGGTDQGEEGHWFWVNGTTEFWDYGPIDGVFQNWLTGQPNNGGAQGANENCLIVQSGAGAQGGRWNDLACDSTGFNATCESTGP